MDLLPSVLKSKKSNNKIIRRERKNVICPYCFLNNVYKNGKTKEQKQRYICRNCKKSFSDNNNSIVYKTKHTYDDWIKFINFELHGYTLKQESDALKITQASLFYWRHKLYEAISEVKKDIYLSGYIQIDAKYVQINLKGTRPPKYA